MQQACTFSDSVLPVQVRRNRAGRCASIFPKVVAVILALSLSGCSKSESVLYSGISQKKPKDAYRAVTAADGLQCGYQTRELSLEYIFDPNQGPRPVPSGTLLGFHCTNPRGFPIEVELASHQMDKGKIETKQFGTIRTDGSNLTAQTPLLYMTEDQIVRLKEFLRTRE